MLMLPVLPAPAEGQSSPPPTLRMLEDATAAQFEESTPIYTIEEDVIGERTTVRTASQRSRGKLLESSMTVSRANPAVATVSARMVREFDFHGQVFAVEARTATASDEQSFHHSVDVEVTRDGAQHWTKRWDVSTPRLLD